MAIIRKRNQPVIKSIFLHKNFLFPGPAGSEAKNEQKEKEACNFHCVKDKVFGPYILDKKKGDPRTTLHLIRKKQHYIMPPMPPISGAPPPTGFSSRFSARTQSVVNNIAATEAAFSSATRLTLVGSITPALKRFS